MRKRSQKKFKFFKPYDSRFLIFLLLFLLALNIGLFIFLQKELFFSVSKVGREEKVIDISVPVVPEGNSFPSLDRLPPPIRAPERRVVE